MTVIIIQDNCVDNRKWLSPNYRFVWVVLNRGREKVCKGRKTAISSEKQNNHSKGWRNYGDGQCKIGIYFIGSGSKKRIMAIVLTFQMFQNTLRHQKLRVLRHYGYQREANKQRVQKHTGNRCRLNWLQLIKRQSQTKNVCCGGYQKLVI